MNSLNADNRLYHDLSRTRPIISPPILLRTDFGEDENYPIFIGIKK